MSVKSTIENVLKQYPPLFRFGSRVYHKLNGSFRTLSPGAPEAILKAFELVQKESSGAVGDYYEFGLFRGYTFLQAYKHSDTLGLSDIHFYGFDSFEGLPPADGIDEADGRFFEGQFACSKEDVEKNLSENGMDSACTTLIKGFYEDSLTESLRESHDFKAASVVMLDCDYYSSTKTALDWMQPYIQTGTVMLFDDWFSYGDDNELGQQKAFDEFLKINPHFKAEPLWEFLNHGKGFIIRNAK
jgi:O-methyltransferase